MKLREYDIWEMDTTIRNYIWVYNTSIVQHSYAISRIKEVVTINHHVMHPITTIVESSLNEINQ